MSDHRAEQAVFPEVEQAEVRRVRVAEVIVVEEDNQSLFNNRQISLTYEIFMSD